MTQQELETAVDAYFDAHLDKTFWAGLSADKRSASVAMALSDVLSLIDGLTPDKITSGSVAVKALAEQAVFLARNYDNLTEGKVVTSEGVEGVSTGYTLIGDMAVAFRAMPLIKQTKRLFCGNSVRISRG